MNTPKMGSLNARRRERGAIIIVAIIVIVAMLILTTPFLLKLTAQFRTTDKAYKSLTALNLAEAGVERAIWELNFGEIMTSPNWTGGNTQKTLILDDVRAADGSAVGDIMVTVVDPTSDYPVVESSGVVPFVGSTAVTKAVRVLLAKGYESIFKYAIFGDDGFDMSGNAYTNSYNSTLGSYWSQTPGDYGDVGTNATGRLDVVLLNNTVINGDAFTGVESDPNQVIRLRSNARITGEQKPLDEPFVFPQINAPSGLPFLGNYTASGHSGVISSGAKFSGFTMPSDTTVTIWGGTEADPITLFIDGNFLMNSNVRIVLAEGAWVEIIMGNGTFVQESGGAGGSSFINPSGDPKRVAILGTDAFKSMTWKSNADFYGVVIAPQATIQYDSNAHFFGSMLSYSLSLNSNAGIHYDEALGTWKKYGIPSDTYVVISWQEKQGL